MGGAQAPCLPRDAVGWNWGPCEEEEEEVEGCSCVAPLRMLQSSMRAELPGEVCQSTPGAAPGGARTRGLAEPCPQQRDGSKKRITLASFFRPPGTRATAKTGSVSPERELSESDMWAQPCKRAVLPARDQAVKQRGAGFAQLPPTLANRRTDEIYHITAPSQPASRTARQPWSPGWRRHACVTQAEMARHANRFCPSDPGAQALFGSAEVRPRRP